MRCPSSLLNGLNATPGSSLPSFTQFTIRAIFCVPPDCRCTTNRCYSCEPGEQRLRYRAAGVLQPSGHALDRLRHVRRLQRPQSAPAAAANRSVSVAQVAAPLSRRGDAGNGRGRCRSRLGAPRQAARRAAPALPRRPRARAVPGRLRRGPVLSLRARDRHRRRGRRRLLVDPCRGGTGGHRDGSGRHFAGLSGRALAPRHLWRLGSRRHHRSKPGRARSLAIPARLAVLSLEAMHILAFLLFGLIVGLLARALYPGRQAMGWLMTSVLGMIGSLVGGLLGHALWGGNSRMDGAWGFTPGGWILSIAGSLGVLFVYLRMTGHRRTV